MPPERMAGTAPDFDVAGDVYSLCAVLHELCTLEHYVPGGAVRDRDEMHARVTKGPYIDAKLRADPAYGAVPVAVSHVCRRGLSKDPKERFASATELHDALQRWFEGRAPVVCPRTAIQRGLCGVNHFLNRHRLAGPALVLVVALTCLAAVVFSAVTLLRR
jgi:serine/threonine-protein kinase